MSRRDEARDPPRDLARALVALSSDGIVVVDSAGRLRYASPSVERMLGHQSGELFDCDVFGLVHPDDQVGALEGFESTVSSADSRPLPTLLRLRRVNGSWLQTEVIATNHLEDEQVRGLLLNIRDVERSMRTEAALRESEEHHRLIVELSREGIWTVDAMGQTTFANRAMAEMLDTTVSEMLECSMFDFMDTDAEAATSAESGRRLPGTAEEHDVRLTTRLGRTVWTRMNTSPIIDPGGAYRGAIALVTDVTDRRALELRLAADARQDALTGVANRIALFEALGDKLRGDRPVAVLYVDLDDFKHVNDVHGHAVGDVVLRAVAARLGGAVRAGDVVARVGGDEFVVISNAVDGEREALALGSRIRDVLASPISVAGIQLEVGASVGVALSCDTDADALLSQADGALYRERAGRRRVELDGADALTRPR